ncbi:hypothetical protein G7068_02205 [Leucobacter viscericola]|uniref:Uncharacterized protein n=1 Tax=Leucobacter viscericola TaxID=2714935 RepID=A0A6G7XC22_9MICO|nr:hypothetical protein [Leucobacter viscericola]QIK62144.1 hypothetical protein G7068_02205 [Leucobacter viscericola]
MSTHSPILASLPEATIFELSDSGLQRRNYEDLELVQNWKLFLDAPERFLRHLGS